MHRSNQKEEVSEETQQRSNNHLMPDDMSLHGFQIDLNNPQVVRALLDRRLQQACLAAYTSYDPVLVERIFLKVQIALASVSDADVIEKFAHFSAKTEFETDKKLYPQHAMSSINASIPGQKWYQVFELYAQVMRGFEPSNNLSLLFWGRYLDEYNRLVDEHNRLIIISRFRDSPASLRNIVNPTSQNYTLEITHTARKRLGRVGGGFLQCDTNEQSLGNRPNPPPSA